MLYYSKEQQHWEKEITAGSTYHETSGPMLTNCFAGPAATYTTANRLETWRQVVRRFSAPLGTRGIVTNQAPQANIQQLECLNLDAMSGTTEQLSPTT